MAKMIVAAAIGAAVMGIGAQAAQADTLSDVKAKGFVQCGVNGSNLAGFGAQDSAGNFVPLHLFDNILHLLLGIGMVALALVLTKGHKAHA